MSPGVAVFSVTASTAKRIAELAEIVKNNGLYEVEVFHGQVSFLQYSPDRAEDCMLAGESNEIATKGDTLNVTRQHFWYSAHIKNHHDVRSDQQSIVDLLAHFEQTPGDTLQAPCSSCGAH